MLFIYIINKLFNKLHVLSFSFSPAIQNTRQHPSSGHAHTGVHTHTHTHTHSHTQSNSWPVADQSLGLTELFQFQSCAVTFCSPTERKSGKCSKTKHAGTRLLYINILYIQCPNLPNYIRQEREVCCWLTFCKASCCSTRVGSECKN